MVRHHVPACCLAPAELHTTPALRPDEAGVAFPLTPEQLPLTLGTELTPPITAARAKALSTSVVLRLAGLGRWVARRAAQGSMIKLTHGPIWLPGCRTPAQGTSALLPASSIAADAPGHNRAAMANRVARLTSATGEPSL